MKIFNESHTTHDTRHTSHVTPQRARKIARDAGRRKGAQRRIPTAVLPQKSKRVLKRDKCPLVQIQRKFGDAVAQRVLAGIN